MGGGRCRPGVRHRHHPYRLAGHSPGPGVAVPLSRVASPSTSNALLGGRDDGEMPGQAPAVLLSGVTRVFGVSAALVRADLRVERGEALVIRGPNGAGKTTLLRLIATAISPTYGSGSVLGFDLLRRREDIRRRTELLGHRTRLYEDLTGAENLRFVCRLFDGDRGGVEEALGRAGLRDAAGERVRGYSQGMRQRLALARTFLRRPELLLFDEPYAGLDAEAKALVDEVMAGAASEGRTVILATHDQSRGTTATRTLLMEGGRLLEVSP
jgi:heme exporter protein A